MAKEEKFSYEKYLECFEYVMEYHKWVQKIYVQPTANEPTIESYIDDVFNKVRKGPSSRLLNRLGALSKQYGNIPLKLITPRMLRSINNCGPGTVAEFNQQKEQGFP